jgi:hypothetical protein
MIINYLIHLYGTLKISLVIKTCEWFQQTKKWKDFNLIQIIMINYDLQQS